MGRYTALIQSKCVFSECQTPLLDDEVLATALLDRILFHCELINLSGKSYRLKNRKPIFES
ncbi:MAG: ATP-binding protein [Chryseolinea sp.]